MTVLARMRVWCSYVNVWIVGGSIDRQVLGDKLFTTLCITMSFHVNFNDVLLKCVTG